MKQCNFSFAWLALLLLPALIFNVSSVFAAVLPEDRADVLYHSYDGGGAEISGPSYLVRKKFSENFSATINHYEDSVSSASIDVITISGASPYTEERTEQSLSLSYLNEKTVMGLGVTESIESDYDAKTFSLNISQDMFGDLTTVSLAYAQGENIVRNNFNDAFIEDVDVRSYRLSLSQVMTTDLILALVWETITDQGYLNNPYRRVRYVDPGNALNYIWQEEVYPNTRTSNAVGVRANYYLPHRAALHAGYRYFSDTWGIEAQTYELGYTLPYKEDWTLEFKYRFYDQTKADFYSDLFPFESAQNYLARDKEMSTFNSHTFGVGANYEFLKNGSGFLKRGSVNLGYDFIRFEYDDFRDLRVSGVVPGTEPLYGLDAEVIRFFVSVWF